MNKTAGRVEIWGFDQDVNPRQSRAAIGVMPQELNIDPFLSPRASLEVQAGLYGVPRADRWTDEILALVGLTEQAESYTRQLSGGMKRRLLLAKALVHRPRILVLDEPTAGMSRADTNATIDLLKRIGERGITKIVIEHDMDFIASLCDPVIVMAEGRIVAEGTPEHVAQDLRDQLLPSGARRPGWQRPDR